MYLTVLTWKFLTIVHVVKVCECVVSHAMRSLSSKSEAPVVSCGTIGARSIDFDDLLPRGDNVGFLGDRGDRGEDSGLLNLISRCEIKRLERRPPVLLCRALSVRCALDVSEKSSFVEY